LLILIHGQVYQFFPVNIRAQDTYQNHFTDSERQSSLVIVIDLIIFIPGESLIYQRHISSNREQLSFLVQILQNASHLQKQNGLYY